MGSKVQIGLAVGRGTGAELASAFEQVIGKLGDIYAVRPVISRSPRIYGSYFSLLPELDRRAHQRGDGRGRAPL
ncbi:hypothetical protein [Nonomuraea sp. NPDC048901]|uniref:hypothetical protein n=1 Tax=Nonomuraea sp. NPDC048901 TaxID=3155627 RepID=UPI0033EFD3A5